MAKAATATNQTTADNQPPPSPPPEPEKALPTKETRAASYRSSLDKADLENLKPGEVECTAVWFPDSARLPNGQRQIILGTSLSISQLTGRVERIVREPSGCIRLHMDIQSGTRESGNRSYLFLGTGYQYAEAMHTTPEALGMVNRL